METVYNHHYYGEIVYRENFWTGKREIIMDGKPLKRIRKNKYEFRSEPVYTTVEVKGSYLLGVKLTINGEIIPITQSPKWYDVVCAALIFFVVAVWGNSVKLCSIFPIAGGAIGGAISGCMSLLALGAMKSTSNVLKKVIIWCAVMACTMLLCFLCALVILGILL